MFMIFAMFAVWLLTLCICIGEAWHERDWPRDTFKAFAIASIFLVLFFNVFG